MEGGLSNTVIRTSSSSMNGNKAKDIVILRNECSKLKPYSWDGKIKGFSHQM